MNVLLGITGSVATIYTDRLIKALVDDGHSVQVVLTKSSFRFVEWQHRVSVIHAVKCYDDSSELWTTRKDSVLHIDLRNWADIMVIAPLSANTMAKIVHGQCDNLLTEVIRAWDFSKPIIACPAMNTMMWENDPTSEQVETLKQRGFDVINPVAKTLACGDVGIGAMCDHETIVKHVRDSEWWNPLDKPLYIPEGPGSFGAIRKHDVHTGVDLYCNDGDNVHAMEDGVIINIAQFTGKALGFPHWEDTDSIFVQGRFGVINYGEVTSTRNVGTNVARGQRIGKVKRVLPFGKERPDIPHHSLSMLHVEYYAPGTSKWVVWNLDCPKPKNLRNPTHRLKLI